MTLKSDEKKFKRKLKQFDSTLDLGWNSQVGCVRVIQYYQGMLCAFGYDIVDEQTGRPILPSELSWDYLRNKLSQRSYARASSKEDICRRLDIVSRMKQIQENRKLESEKRTLEICKDAAKTGFNILHKTTLDMGANL